MESTFSSTQFPKTRSSSKKPLCLLLYNNLSPKPQNYQFTNIWFFQKNVKKSKIKPYLLIVLLLFSSFERSISKFWAEAVFPQKNLVPESTPFLKQDQSHNFRRVKEQKKIVIITVEEKLIVPEYNPVSGGRNDGASANHGGGANDPVNVNQSFSGSHFCFVFFLVAANEESKVLFCNESGYLWTH